MMDQMDWIDLPSDNFIQILGTNNQNTYKLHELATHYHSLRKDSAALLPKRISALQNIHLHLSHWIDHEVEKQDKPKHLRFVKSINKGKLNYLKALDHIYSNGLYKSEDLEYYHTCIQDLIDKKWKPVFLNNQCFFSVKMREYWGDFWLESLDPCHRRLTPFYHQWKQVQSKDPQVPHFFLWLETQHLPKYVPRVRYMDQQELEKAEVYLQNGLLCHSEGNALVPTNFSEGGVRYLFAIDLKGRIYVANESDGFSHSSFTHGKPVLGAGLIRTEAGKLVSIALESGHYLPSIDIGYQILSLFLEKKTSLKNSLEVVYFYDRNKYRALITEKDLLDIRRFKNALETARSNHLTSVYQ